MFIPSLSLRNTRGFFTGDFMDDVHAFITYPSIGRVVYQWCSQWVPERIWVKGSVLYSQLCSQILSETH